MATYLELNTIVGDGELRNRIRVAAVIAAQIVMDGEDTVAPFDQTAGAHDKRLQLANMILQSPEAVAEKLHYYVLAANSGATLAQITGASDAAIQANVNEAIDPIAAVLSGTV